MASLIGPLVSGIRGAESGTAEIYQRGTSSTASAYSDKDAAVAVTLHPLDANGGVVRYVTSSVDVICKDSTGATVRQFTWEDRAEAVEVKNLGFTGTLANGGTGAGGRTTVDAALSSLFTSLGATDGNVLLNGAATPLKTAVGNLQSAIVYNVQLSPYSAKGDGSTDDTASIQRAIDAAATSGGIVYFPPTSTSYKVTASLNVTTAKVHFMGSGPGSTTLSTPTNSATILSVSGDDFICDGLAFTASGTSCILMSLSGNRARVNSCNFANTSTATVMVLASGTNHRFHGCEFTPGSSANPFLSSATGVVLTACNFTQPTGGSTTLAISGTADFVGCNFTQAITTGNLINASGASARIRVIGGRLTFSAATSPADQITGASGAVVTLNGVDIHNTGAAGAMNLIASVAGFTANVIGCYVDATSSQTITLNASGGQTVFNEAGSLLSNIASGTVPGAPGLGSTAFALTRMGRANQTSGSAISYTPDHGKYMIHQVTSSGASFKWNNPSPAGNWFDILILKYRNTNAGAITPTLDTAYKGNSVSVGANQTATWIFIFDGVNSVWTMVGATPSAYAF